jgi:diguanylate cyclase (GGDEF)-like protein/PAS domain S-box-containing protein
MYWGGSMAHGTALMGFYDYRLVALSVLLAMVAAYAALDLAGRVTAARGTVRFAWLSGGAFTMGLGIWSMHYVGMQAMRLPVPVKYDWPTVLLSMLAAVLASGVALFVVSRKTMGIAFAIAGSILMGSGIAAMHYIGMAAMRLPATCRYSSGLVALSFIVAIVVSFMAMWLAFGVRDKMAPWSWRKSGSALVMGLAIPVMHYIGMAAVRFRPAPLPTTELTHAIDISMIGLAGIAMVILMLLSAVVLASIVDRRSSLHALELEASQERYRFMVELNEERERARIAAEAQNKLLQASATRYRRLFETAQDGIFLLDAESGKVVDVNLSVVKMLGYSRDHFLQQRLCDVLPFNEIAACRSALVELQTANSVCFDHWLLQARGKSPVDVEFVGNVYHVDSARIVQCNLRDITSRKQAEDRVRYMAMHDALTGLPNRALLQDRLTQAIASADRSQRRIAVLMLDLDKFKHTNDSLGHHVGDGLLKEVSRRLKACLRESDVVARLGGDEFIIVLLEAMDDTDIQRVAQKLLAALLEPFHIDGNELRVSGSVGISLYPGDGENPDALLHAADLAMYEAKAKGRGLCCMFTPELDVATQRRLRMVSDLQNAHEQGQFVLHYQPQVATDSEDIIAVEALLRWNHPQHGMISPGEFIPLLEEMGLIVEVGRWVTKTACLQNVAWQKTGLPPVRMAVNVSAQQFYAGNIVQVVEDALSESQMEAKWLELELTESLSLDASETTLNTMHRLKAIGVCLALDDFGTGWSSLSCIRNFPIDRIKIDRSFMRDLTSQPAAKAVVQSIIQLASNLGFCCIAEGVETEEQLECLKQDECAEIQGFLYSRPVTAIDCAVLLRSGSLSFTDASKKTTDRCEQEA